MKKKSTKKDCKKNPNKILINWFSTLDPKNVAIKLVDIVYNNGQCAVVYVRLGSIHYIYLYCLWVRALSLHLFHSMLSTSINCKNVDTYQKMYKCIYIEKINGSMQPRFGMLYFFHHCSHYCCCYCCYWSKYPL